MSHMSDLLLQSTVCKSVLKASPNLSMDSHFENNSWTEYSSLMRHEAVTGKEEFGGYRLRFQSLHNNVVVATKEYKY